MSPTSRTTIASLLGAAAIGTIAGVASMATTDDGRRSVVETVRTVAIVTGVARRRSPETGDHWGGCNDARAAGTAPIYVGEPGYRDDMDGDGDGIACEPQRS